jgi:Mitochondrial ribosomal protein L31
MLIISFRKTPWRLSSPQKARQRKRLRLVDRVVDTVSAALQRNGAVNAKAIDRWYSEMPREEEMLPKDKYTIFDRKEKKYRKGIHSPCQLEVKTYRRLANVHSSTELPKWTRVSQRVNPPGF